jgi:hypothetical protein
MLADKPEDHRIFVEDGDMLMYTSHVNGDEELS